MTLRLLVDSADPKYWERFMCRGWAYGATTNPLILTREGRPVNMGTYQTLVNDAKHMGLAELHIQATGPHAGELAESGLRIAGLWDKIKVKVPSTAEGLAAAKILADAKVPLTLTAAYAAHQMVAAAMLDAAYIAPYYGRLLEADRDADGILESMRSIRDKSGSQTRILIASLRSVEQIEHLLALGHDTFTLAPEVADALATDDMSDAAAADFERARLG
ncbi:MAG: transaldolase [Rhodospirillales bacterium]|jgi:transaldolase|nr:transaldolase [Rhodospirillales bacterium]